MCLQINHTWLVPRLKVFFEVMRLWFKNIIFLLSFSLFEKTGCFGAQTGVMGNVVWKNVLKLKPCVLLNLMLFNMQILHYS